MLSRQVEVIIACCLSAIPLWIVEEADFRIIKIILYARATTAVIKIFGSLTNLYEPAGDFNDPRTYTVEYLIGVFSSVFVCYAFIFETEAMSDSLKQSFVRGTDMLLNEKYLFDSMRAIVEIQKRRQSM